MLTDRVPRNHVLRTATLWISLLWLGLYPFSSQADFSFDEIIAKARELASRPYAAPAPIPKTMRELGYEAYQGIRFDPEQSLWRESQSAFQVMLMPAGLYFKHAVGINIVDAEGTHKLDFDKSHFSYSDPAVEKRLPADLGYAGFKLTYPLREPKAANQFLVFAGASYFRGVGKQNNFGISARGLAIDTGLPGGEAFPNFTEFWLVRPAPDANAMIVYALLDGENITGAYQFHIYPGKATRIEVSAVLFPRRTIELLGIAPLTSMFYYGQNTVRPAGEWRPQVHDSDGLLIHNGGSDERLWRPLLNPLNLEMDYFQTENVRGFGLLQRENQFQNFQDLEAMYHSRPSTWVSTRGDWGPGEVVLVQIPTRLETNDNIVAFWRPKTAVQAGNELRFAYTLSFGNREIAAHPLGKVVNTFVGDGSRIGGGAVENAYRFIVDFAGEALDKLPTDAPVVGNVSLQGKGEILEHFVEYNRPAKAWRLSILARPAAGESLDLRAYLLRQEEALSETWNYRLPFNNGLIPRDK